MTMGRTGACRAAVAVLAAALAGGSAGLPGGASAALAQPLTERTPTLAGPWVTSPRNLHFQFSHHFQLVGGDVDISDLFGDAKVQNYPTFELAYGLFADAMAGVRYSSRPNFAGRVNEWQPFVKFAPLRGVGGGRLSLSLMGAWNEANDSFDGEVVARTAAGPVFLLGAIRGFTDIYDLPPEVDDEAVALAGGIGVRVNKYVTLAADVADLVAGPDGDAAWSAGVNLGIPFTPHTFSLKATNVTSGTLAGSSRGFEGDAVFWGFEFTVPFSGVARWGRIFRPEELREPAADRPEGERVVEVEISGFEYRPPDLRIPAGTTVRWVNRDPVGHTATSDDGSWGSALIGPGETFERTFREPGEHPYHCTPHPFMEAVVRVTGG